MSLAGYRQNYNQNQNRTFSSWEVFKKFPKLELLTNIAYFFEIAVLLGSNR